MIESSNLKKAAAKGLFWSAVERFGSQGIQFVFGVFITRILSPADYGFVGMILIFDAVGQTLVDSGLGSALIWKKNTSEIDKSTVFYFNICISIFLYSLLFFLAPVISAFYNEPNLIELIRLMSFNIVVMAFSLIQLIDIQKRIEFKLLAAINITGSIVSGTVSLFLAIQGAGALAIVVQILLKNLLTALSLWIFNKWRPLLEFSWKSLKQLFSFGLNLMAVGLIGNISQYLYFNIIGKLFPITLLGYYTRAVQLQEFPIKSIANIYYRVAFPVFSSIQDENIRLRNALRKTLQTMVFVTFPIMFGLIAIADSLIIVVFTDKWIPASEYFKLLCLIGLFYPFQVVNNEILKSKGKSNWMLWLEVITRTVWIANIFITWRWGIKAIIVGQMISVFFSWLLGSFFVWKIISYSIWQQIKDIFPYIITSLIMYVVISIVGLVLHSQIISLFIMTILGVIIYMLFSWLMKIEEIKDVISFGISFFKSIKYKINYESRIK